MFEGTDNDIREAVERLVKAEELDDDRLEPIVLMVQRLVWPLSPYHFMHEDPHMVLTVGKRSDSGWTGQLRCPQGCARMWTVNQGPSEEAVHGALAAAHQEYRTGKVTAVAPPGSGHRVSLDDLFNRSEYVEVQDERLTGAWTALGEVSG